MGFSTYGDEGNHYIRDIFSCVRQTCFGVSLKSACLDKMLLPTLTN